MSISKQPSLAAIILAAGSSSRMEEGRHKLLLPLQERPVLAHVIAAAEASQASPIIVILGHQANDVRSRIAPYISRPDVVCIENPAYKEGMSTSLKTGLQYLLSDGYKKENTQTQVGGAIILLGDQPLITASIINRLIVRWQETQQPVITPLYHGKRGNPVLFSASLFAELQEVTGDEGGRSILARHASQIETVEMGDTRATYDVDTWEAYQQVVREWENRQK